MEGFKEAGMIGNDLNKKNICKVMHIKWHPPNDSLSIINMINDGVDNSHPLSQIITEIRRLADRNSRWLSSSTPLEKDDIIGLCLLRDFAG
ncbi:uncharacterized protein G2W53_039222 [Senna tora]|uniref:Uncharacterized protein n=1 Tax=Senna tora TaxID=362788 RepID=A0A834SP78_9FABA|nr:uncharacterized protein G2W53_039222 [Senna tora]